MPNAHPGRDIRDVLNEWMPTDAEGMLRREERAADLGVSHLLYKLRTEAGLTQAELAEKVNTGRTTIARLEDAEYKGNSLALLRRIAYALGKEVYIVIQDVAPAETPAEEVPASAA